MKNNIFTYVDILFKDGNYLKKAVIFPNGERGELAIRDIEKITNKLNDIESQDMISFQTSYINGKFHASSVSYFNVYVEAERN